MINERLFPTFIRRVTTRMRVLKILMLGNHFTRNLTLSLRHCVHAPRCSTVQLMYTSEKFHCNYLVSIIVIPTYKSVDTDEHQKVFETCRRMCTNPLQTQKLRWPRADFNQIQTEKKKQETGQLVILSILTRSKPTCFCRLSPSIHNTHPDRKLLRDACGTKTNWFSKGRLRQ